MRTMTLASASLALALLGGCGEKIDAQQEEACGDPGTVTYVATIDPLLQRHCRRCHSSAVTGSERNGAPTYLNYDTFEDARRAVDAAVDRISAGSMPPDATMPACDRRLFEAWAAQGTPES